MAIEVKLTATLQKLAGGARSVQSEGSNVREVLEDLERRHPGIQDMVMRTSAFWSSWRRR